MPSWQIHETVFLLRPEDIRMLRAVLVILGVGGFLCPSRSDSGPRSSMEFPADAGSRDSVPDGPAGDAELDGWAVSTCASAKPAATVMPVLPVPVLPVTVLPVTGVSDIGLDLVKASERFIATPRWDRTRWRIGYGTRTDDPNATMTEARASDLLKERLAHISSRIIARSTVPLQQDHVDALTSLAYNVGEAALFGDGRRAPSTLWRKLQAGDFEGAAAEFQRWNRVGRTVLTGLTKRRDREAELFRRGNQRVR